jgi:hypothetical protein
MMMKNYSNHQFLRRSPTTTHTADNKQQEKNKKKNRRGTAFDALHFFISMLKGDRRAVYLFTYRELENDIWKFTTHKTRQQKERRFNTIFKLSYGYHS